ncbi:hypothetical protein CR513_58477, partial [Mucuna pruriens]
MTLSFVVVGEDLVLLMVVEPLSTLVTVEVGSRMSDVGTSDCGRLGPFSTSARWGGGVVDVDPLGLRPSRGSGRVRLCWSCPADCCQSAAYYYHGLILDEGNMEKSHGMVIDALQVVDEYFKESTFIIASIYELNLIIETSDYVLTSIRLVICSDDESEGKKKQAVMAKKKQG